MAYVAGENIGSGETRLRLVDNPIETEHRNQLVARLGDALTSKTVDLTREDCQPFPASTEQGIPLRQLLEAVMPDSGNIEDVIDKVWLLFPEPVGEESGVINKPILSRLSGDLRIDRDSNLVELKGVPTYFRPKEFKLLAHFAETPYVIHSREKLLKEVWDSDAKWQDKSTVTEHNRRLRLKFYAAGLQYPVITRRGIGYQFVDPSILKTD